MLTKNASEFEENGFVEIAPNQSFLKFLDGLSDDIVELTPKYEQAHFPKVNFRTNGEALSQRLHNGLELPNELKQSNPLFGKRVIIDVHDFPKSIISIVEHPYILEKVKEILETDDIVLHNGSLAVSYPGNTGNDKQYHTDTAGFTDRKKSLSCLTENRYILNVMLLLDDVDDLLAPMEVIKETHTANSYFEINSLVSNRLGLDKKIDNLTQNNWVYDELLEGINLKKHTFKGSRGCLSLMHSSILHRATENQTSNKERRVLILNFGRKKDKIFRRHYPMSKSRLFINNLTNKSLADNSYKQSSLALDHILSRFKKINNNFFELITRQINRVKNPEYVFFRIRRNLEKFINRYRDLNREYLNIGSGGHWYHERFYSLDVDLTAKKNLGKINFNLVEDLPLPFKDNTIKGVYSSHCLEHLTADEVVKILQEAHRVIKPGGIIRITLPNMDKMFDAYESRDASNLESFKKKVQIKNGTSLWGLDSWLRLVTRSFAGHVVDLFSDKELYNIFENNSRSDFVKTILAKADTSPKYRNIPNTHKSYWSPYSMQNCLQKVGFKSCKVVQRRETMDKVFSNGLMFNNTQPEMSFYMEAIK